LVGDLLCVSLLLQLMGLQLQATLVRAFLAAGLDLGLACGDLLFALERALAARGLQLRGAVGLRLAVRALVAGILDRPADDGGDDGLKTGH
jgi:hypothetical protein